MIPATAAVGSNLRNAMDESKKKISYGKKFKERRTKIWELSVSGNRKDTRIGRSG